MLIFGSLAIFLVAIAAVAAATVFALRMVGMAMNANRTPGNRARLWLAAALGALAIPAAAAAGFSGISALFWFAQAPASQGAAP